MVSMRYVAHELRRRWSRTLVTALGLACGVGLVMGIVGVSNGLSNAQAEVLSPLSTVGTDIVIERTVGVADTSAAGTSAPASTTTTSTAPPSGGGGQSAFFGSGEGQLTQNQIDEQDLADNNTSVITDLAKLGPPGTKFSADFFVTGTLITFPQSAVADVTRIAGVTSAVPALSMQALHEQGTVPEVVDRVTTGGQTITQTSMPAAVTSSEVTQIVSCLERVNALPAEGNVSNIDFSSTTGEAFTSCLPIRFRQYIATVVVPQETITRVLNPPTTNTATQGYTVAGVDPASPNSGLITKAQLVSGTWFTGTPAHEVLVSTAYASTHDLKVGQRLTIDKVAYQVVGLVNPTLTGDASDIYFDLSTLQSDASQASRINEVLVKVARSDDVGPVAAAIKKELPGATILTSKQLASQVTGSLQDAKKLASDLGVALGIIILVAALFIAALLTLSSIAKRVREIGTLRAIGWSRGRVMSQIMAEMLGIGVIGAVLGVLVGLAVCLAVNTFGPTLAYSTSGAVVGASSLSGLLHGATAAAASAGTTVKLHTAISALTVVVAVAMALLGGLLAGLAGAWSAARLSPIAALRDLG